LYLMWLNAISYALSDILFTVVPYVAQCNFICTV
jgi:hypothetical protein